MQDTHIFIFLAFAKFISIFSAVAAHSGTGPRAIPSPENRENFQFLRTQTAGQDVDYVKTLSVLLQYTVLLLLYANGSKCSITPI